jgi:glycosyltransferase involved in cell wall biosynthesis
MDTTIIIPTQGTRPEMIKEAIASVKAQTVPCELIIADEVGDLEKFNRAVKKAKGKYILLLCDDDKLDPTFLEKTERLMDRNDMVSTFMEVFGDVPIGEHGIHGPDRYPFITTLFRKELFDKVGGFDTSIGPMGDVEFWWRCLQSGARWTKIAEPLFKYRKHANQDSNTCNWAESMKKVRAKHPNYIW